MLTPFPHIAAEQQDRDTRLRALNREFRETQEALNHSAASINRAIKLNEQNYHRKRKAILANGHAQEPL